MNDWTAIIRTFGDLIYLAAAIITLIAAITDRTSRKIPGRAAQKILALLLPHALEEDDRPPAIDR
jgi:hypothetical protein